jgi:hypothetical protein
MVGTFQQPISIGDPASTLARGRGLGRYRRHVHDGPGPLLNRLGVVPHTRRRLILADSQALESRVSRSWVRVEEQEGITLLVFGDQETPVLGAFTLEALGLGVDPVDQRLVRVAGLLMQTASRRGSPSP